jgi:3-oxoacyl-[acyl-carrier protein] reductase
LPEKRPEQLLLLPATKAGIIGATKSLAIEMSSRGITVNAIAPGIIKGSMTQDIFDEDYIKKTIPIL